MERASVLMAESSLEGAKENKTTKYRLEVGIELRESVCVWLQGVKSDDAAIVSSHVLAEVRI